VIPVAVAKRGDPGSAEAVYRGVATKALSCSGSVLRELTSVLGED
jgi:hypothetical protein